MPLLFRSAAPNSFPHRLGFRAAEETLDWYEIKQAAFGVDYGAFFDAVNGKTFDINQGNPNSSKETTVLIYLCTRRFTELEDYNKKRDEYETRYLTFLKNILAVDTMNVAVTDAEGKSALMWLAKSCHPTGADVKLLKDHETSTKDQLRNARKIALEQGNVTFTNVAGLI